MCVVFLCITVTHGTDESPLTFGLNRISDTTVGIMIALLIKQIPVAEQKVEQTTAAQGLADPSLRRSLRHTIK